MFINMIYTRESIYFFAGCLIGFIFNLFTVGIDIAIFVFCMFLIFYILIFACLNSNIFKKYFFYLMQKWTCCNRTRNCLSAYHPIWHKKRYFLIKNYLLNTLKHENKYTKLAKK